MDFIWFCLVLPSFIEFNLVVLVLTLFYSLSNLFRFNEVFTVLPSFTGFFLALLGFTLFYLILLIFQTYFT